MPEVPSTVEERSLVIGCCHDCGKASPYYMAREDTWLAAWPTYDSDRARLLLATTEARKERGSRFCLELCFACLEKRLGRALTLKDFSAHSANDPIRFGYRLGRHSMRVTPQW